MLTEPARSPRNGTIAVPTGLFEVGFVGELAARRGARRRRDGGRRRGSGSRAGALRPEHLADRRRVLRVAVDVGRARLERRRPGRRVVQVRPDREAHSGAGELEVVSFPDVVEAVVVHDDRVRARRHEASRAGSGCRSSSRPRSSSGCCRRRRTRIERRGDGRSRLSAPARTPASRRKREQREQDDRGCHRAFFMRTE